MCKSITKRLFDYLLDHVAQIEKEKEALIKAYYAENVEEGMNIDDFFKDYKNTISSFLRGVEIQAEGTDHCPFVIIGSDVEVEDTTDMETYTYRIIFPYTKNPTLHVDCASCLSPLGKALLLKNVDQQVRIEVPTGTLHYKIKGVTAPLSSEEQQVAVDIPYPQQV